LLLAFAYRLVDNQEDSLKFLGQATGRSLKDPEQVQGAINLLDTAGQYDEALAVLERTAEVGGDLRFRRLVIERLYQAGKYQQVIDRLATLDSQMEKADTHLLAHRAMALAALKRDVAAKRIVEFLAAGRG